MLKIVVFDSGYGGELFADLLEEKLGVVEVIRVIDWRNAKFYLDNPREARKLAEIALRPYLGRVDLIFFANHILSMTSLKYFCRHYKQQPFLGFKLPAPKDQKRTLILATKAVAKTISFKNYLFRLKADRMILTPDAWPALIDDGELTLNEISSTLESIKSFNPEQIMLICGQFSDIKPELRSALSANIKIQDSFDDSFREVCKTLKIRGAAGKKKY
ncbi:MAG: hypothetical protein Q4B29_00595 [Candidatus Saccharibacteria bacterium]|nr:hypothetical protein [Candidatus Saccharibacteria bacterium]